MLPKKMNEEGLDKYYKYHRYDRRIIIKRYRNSSNKSEKKVFIFGFFTQGRKIGIRLSLRGTLARE